MHFPFTPLNLDNRLLILENALLKSGGQRRKTLSADEQAVRDFERALFDSLVNDEIRSLYYESQRETANKDCGLRIKPHFNAPDLAALPWEYLFDPRRDEYVALSTDTPLVRYLALPQSSDRSQFSRQCACWGWWPIPLTQSLDELNVPLEKQRIERALVALQAKGLVKLTWLEGESWRDLQRAMRRVPWHIFYFIGHGGFDEIRDEGILNFTNRNGRPRKMTATDLGWLLSDPPTLRLVLLNACEGARGSQRDIFSSTAAVYFNPAWHSRCARHAVRHHRDAMQPSNLQRPSIYDALTDALPIDAAVTEARKAISISIAVNNTLE